jgi:hypothetical protein
MTDTIPSTPDPELTTLVGVMVRAVFYCAGTATTIFGGTCSFCGAGANAAMLLAGPLVLVGTAAWALWQQIQAKRRDHANSVASAKLSLERGVVTPVEVVKS